MHPAPNPRATPEELLEHDRFLRAVARSLIGDPAAADDVVQQSYVAALERPRRRAGSLRAWLAAIVHHLASKRRRGEARRARHEAALPRPDPVPSVAEVLAEEELRRKVVAAVLALDEPARSTMLLRYFRQMAPGAIAKQLGEPVETIRTRIKRALERVRCELDRRHGGERRAWLAALAPLAQAAPLGPIAAAAGATTAALGTLVSGVLVMSAKAKVISAAAVIASAAVAWMFLHEGPADDATHARTAAAGASAPLAAPAAVAADSELPRIDPARTAETRVPAPDAPAATADDSRFGKLLVKATWERDRSPAANVTLFLYVWGRADSYLFLPEARTDAQGLATFDRLEPGHFLVVGDRSGQARGAVAAGTTTEVALTLEKGLELAGEVVDARGEGVADAAIWLGFDGNQSDHGTVVARSDGHGRFVVASVTGDRNVGARKSGFAPSLPQFVSGTPGTTVRVRLELAARGGLVRGRIVDPDDRPVAGAIVQLGDEGRRIERPGTFPCEMLLLTRSDADGRFEFDGAMAGEQLLAVRARELAPWSGRVVVNPDVPADVGITLPRGATLEGRVVDAKQQPVGGAVVSLAGPCRLLATQREAAPDGAYRIDHVAPGAFEVRAELEGKSRTTRAQFTFVDGATVHWDPALASALTLHGRVVDGDGHALAKYWVAVEGAGDADRGDWFSSQATSDAAGRFTVEGCPATEVTVTAHPPAGMSVAATLEHVRVTDAELVVTVTSDRLCSVFLQGVVVGDDGQPIENATIVPHERGARTAPILPTDPRTGRFRIGPFAPGEFHLTAQAAGYAERVVAVGPLRKDETRDLGTIRLERGAPMTIRIHDEAGRVPEGFSLAVRAAGTDRSPRSAFAGGVVAFERACPGRYELLASAPGFVPLFREIVVENDKPVDLDLTLRAGRAVTLRATFSTQLRESIGRDGSRAALVLRDASGTTLARFMIGPQADPAMTPWIQAVALLSGRHTLDLVVDDEATASVAFEVENDAAFERPIELEFD